MTAISFQLQWSTAYSVPLHTIAVNKCNYCSRGNLSWFRLKGLWKLRFKNVISFLKMMQKYRQKTAKITFFTHQKLGSFPRNQFTMQEMQKRNLLIIKLEIHHYFIWSRMAKIVNALAKVDFQLLWQKCSEKTAYANVWLLHKEQQKIVFATIVDIGCCRETHVKFVL